MIDIHTETMKNPDPRYQRGTAPLTIAEEHHHSDDIAPSIIWDHCFASLYPQDRFGVWVRPKGVEAMRALLAAHGARLVGKGEH